MGVAAGSMCLLSMLPEGTVARIVEDNRERYARHPSQRHIDEDVISAQVFEARQRGYAVNMGYYLPGEGGLGLPIFAERPYYTNMAISFNAPLELMSKEWIETMMEELRECVTRGTRSEGAITESGVRGHLRKQRIGLNDVSVPFVDKICRL